MGKHLLMIVLCTSGIACGMQEAANILANVQADEKLRQEQWRQFKARAPRALQGNAEEMLLFFDTITAEVLEHQALPDDGDMHDYSAERLFQMALFCQTKNLLRSAYAKGLSLWQVLNKCKRTIDEMEGDAITLVDQSIVHQACKDQTLGLHHDGISCIGDAGLCKNCRRFINSLVSVRIFGSCCKDSALLPISRKQSGFACGNCTQALKHHVYVKLKNLIIGFRECGMLPQTQEDTELIKWAIMYQISVKKK